MKTLSSIIAAIVACVFLAGCGDSTGPDAGTFTVNVTGDTTFSFEGQAVFGISTTQNREHWALALTRGNFGGQEYDVLGIGRHNSSTPIGVGTHTISSATNETPAADDIDAVYILSRIADGSLASYGSVSGSLTITSASDAEVTGEFTFTASFVFTVGSFSQVRDITLSGSFNAVPGNVPTIAAHSTGVPVS